MKRILALLPLWLLPWLVVVIFWAPESLHAKPRPLARVEKYLVSLDSWRARADSIRLGILKGARLYPLPGRTPLNTRFSHPRVRDGYIVEDVAFEATPGFYVFGNLYRPLNPQGKIPGILVAHGHFRSKEGWFARIAPENQILCARLAQMGAVAFTYDMVGYGDAQQLKHKTKNVLKLQLWNSIRSVDFLQSLAEVDPNRIGVTGASGGATQAILLAAVDDRIQASMPVVMIASGHTGRERCEDGMPVRNVTGQEKTNNTEIAAAIAPKPLMIVSDGADWTKHFARDEFPYVRSVYGLFGARTQVRSVFLEDERHDYGPTKRAIAYEFFGKSLGLKPLPQLPWTVPGNGMADPDPEAIQLESPFDQTVLNWITIPELTNAQKAGLKSPSEGWRSVEGMSTATAGALSNRSEGD